MAIYKKAKTFWTIKNVEQYFNNPDGINQYFAFRVSFDHRITNESDQIKVLDLLNEPRK